MVSLCQYLQLTVMPALDRHGSSACMAAQSSRGAAKNRPGTERGAEMKEESRQAAAVRGILRVPSKNRNSNGGERWLPTLGRL